MMATDYLHLYTGNMMEVQRICMELEGLGIKAIVKDQETSAALAGFAVPAMLDAVKVFVHKDEFENAKSVF